MPKQRKKPYIYLRKDGRYEGRYRKYVSSDKKEFKQVSVYGSTYEETLEKVLKEQLNNTMEPINDKNILIKELMELWLLDIKQMLKPSSYALYQNYAWKYILPVIGNRKAADFNENTLSSVLETIRMRKENQTMLAQGTVYILEEILRNMFHYGMEKKLIAEVYFGKVKYNTKNLKSVVPLTKLEIQLLISVVETLDIQMQIFILLPLYTGVTLSELCGLKWKDINLELGKIYVHRSLKRIPQIAEDKDKTDKKATVLMEYELSENECREFVIPKKLYKLLKMIADEKKPLHEMYVTKYPIEEKTKEKVIKDSKKKTIVSLDGRTLQYRLKMIGKQAGIPELSFRILRDTFAVMCLQAGGDVYSLAYVMGITVSAVCERYQPWIVKKDEFLKEIG